MKATPGKHGVHEVAFVLQSGGRMITKANNDPRHFADALARFAPGVEVPMVLPGSAVHIG